VEEKDMLDVKGALEDFKPIDLESIEERTGELPENISEAIKLFNRALEDALSKNEDLAIIGLRKAISLDPTFYEAMNLLGLCFAMVGKERAAVSAFQQVIDADDSSIKALEYMNKLQGLDDVVEEDAVKPVKRKTKPKRDGENKPSFLANGLKAEDTSFFWMKYIVGIIIGVLLTSLIWYMVPTNKALFTFEKIETIDPTPELDEEISLLNERIEKLEEDIRKTKDENLKLMDDFQTYKQWVELLNEANKEYLNGNYVQSAEILYNTHGMAIPQSLTEQYEQLREKVTVNAAERLYVEGNSIYNGNYSRDFSVYEQALEIYETAIFYLEGDTVSFMPALYYQAGKAAARCDQKQRAMELFESVINEYPNSSYSSYASTRLNELREGRDISGS
jgi:tetratricopeptide (TPR) repeat protein